MLLIFEGGRSQLFPGTKFLQKDSVVAEKQFDEVGASQHLDALATFFGICEQ